MKTKLYPLLVLCVLLLPACPKPPDPPDPPDPKEWRVTENGPIIEIHYGSGVDFPQYAALDTASGYLRLIPTRDSVFGTSVATLPSFWTLEAIAPSTELVVDFGDEQVINFVIADGYFFVETLKRIYRSADAGETWETVYEFGEDSGRFYALDLDHSDLYAGTSRGILKSTDYGATFESIFSWHWDPSVTVDFQDGYGWAMLPNWGSVQGLIYFDPSVEHWDEIGFGNGGTNYTRYVVADPMAPQSVVYAAASADAASRMVVLTSTGFESEDLGNHTVLFAGKVGADGVRLIAKDGYSWDQGQTWTAIPGHISKVTEDSTTGTVYAARTSTDIWSVTGDDWQPLGLRDFTCVALAAVDGNLFAIDNTNKLYAVTSSENVTPTYHQGDVESFTYSYYASGSYSLTLDADAVIAGVTTSVRYSFTAPTSNTFSARVSVSCDAPEVLVIADRPGEAFKPVFLSSMRISPSLWDCQQAIAGTTTVNVPSEQWIIHPPIESTFFALTGGTSDWKVNAPTTEVRLDDPMLITGWVTPSNDPNDDNVGYWAATTVPLEQWSYQLRAVKP